ncbi:MAG: Uma2 family endonuclease [Prosthecobacter sp.]|uniref:Uma2 family endonuclease n=1 Tax=Prosthecobacter sp. TaxID=1965333 RepID=UPI0039008D25
MPPVVLQNLPGHAEAITSPPMVGNKLLSAEEFEAMPESGDPCELVKGVIQPHMPNNVIHSEISAAVAYLLREHVIKHRLSMRILSGEVGVHTVQGAETTTRAADLAVISKERLPVLPESGFLRVMPELLVEIISGSNTWTDTFEKIYEYFEGGAKLVWIVDPAMQEVRVFQSAKDNDLLRASSGDALTGGDVLPGFSVPVADVFAV